MAVDLTARGMAAAASRAALSDNQVRVFPADANTAYVIAPHATLGAIAVKFMKANGGDASTPSNSIGPPFGGWRLAGFRRLSSVFDNPATAFVQILSDDIGSQQFACRYGTTFGGVYHGGLTDNKAVYTTLTDLTSEVFLPAFVMYHEFALDWGGGVAMTGKERITITPDGRIRTVTYVAGGVILDPAYLDMTIAEYTFDRAKALADAAWTKILGNADGVSDTDYQFSMADTIVQRDRASGVMITVTDDARAQAEYKQKWLRRSPVGGSQRSKIYAKLASASALSPVTVTRTISFDLTPADVFSWTGALDGYDGVGKAANISLPVLTGGILRFTRAASTQTKAKFRVGGLTPGATYRIPISTTRNGGGATDSSNGMTYAVTTPDTDSVLSPVPYASYTYAQVSVAASPAGTGYLQFTVPAGVTMVGIIVQQTTGTAGQIVDLVSLGAPVLV